MITRGTVWHKGVIRRRILDSASFECGFATAGYSKVG